MRIGINEIVINDRSSGNRQREISSLPSVISKLKDRRWDVNIYISQKISKSLVQRMTRGVDECRIVQTSIPAAPGYKRIFREAIFWKSCIERDGIQLLHTSTYPVPRLNIPVVLTVNDVRFIHLPKSYKLLRLLFLRIAVPISLKRAKRIIAISQNTKDDLVRYYGVPESKVDVAYISPATQFHPINDRFEIDKVKTKYRLPDHYILYVGTLEPRKNLKRLLMAYNQIVMHIPHKIVILGKPNYGYHDIMKEVKGSPLESKVIFTGYVEDSDMPQIYSSADLLAFPSLHEGFGIPVLEAMACGTPVITSSCSALPEVAGDAAILVDPYNIKAIADGMAEILTNPQLAKKLVELGFRRVQHFRAKDSGLTIVESYDKAMS